MSKPTSAEYTRGALYGLAAASIWSGWIVAARLGVITSLTPWDIAALRFGVGGMLLVPYLWQKGLAIERLGWIGITALVLPSRLSARSFFTCLFMPSSPERACLRLR